MASDELGSPMLLIEVRSSTFHNVFSSIQCIFGEISIHGIKSDARAVLKQDAAGWAGSSSLIISILVPAFNLAIDPHSTRISLAVHTTPLTAYSLTPKPGLDLSLFTANLMDLRTVHVVSQRVEIR
jgi:hypothetical protein